MEQRPPLPGEPPKSGDRSSGGVVAVILAAGESSRLGSPKQLLEFQGETLLERLAREVKASGVARVMVVLGAHRSRILPLVSRLNVEARINREWRKGMAGSIKIAAEWTGSHSERPAGVLLLAVDQPRITRVSICRLIQAFAGRPDRIVAARYAGILGIPVILGRAFIPELMKLQGDRGAKALLEEFSLQVIPVDMEEAALDIDHQKEWDDYRGSDTMSE